MTKILWVRYLFTSNQVQDPRPITFPPPGPYWITGEGQGYATLAAYLPVGVSIHLFWPEARVTDVVPAPNGPQYSSRFRKPEWYHEPA